VGFANRGRHGLGQPAVAASRESGVPEGLRGQTAPVDVCVDQGGRITRYDVKMSAQGSTIKIHSTISDHGRAPALDPLGPDERPRSIG
jgi:hypothetical protein